jgi:hypothetical protein
MYGSDAAGMLVSAAIEYQKLLANCYFAHDSSGFPVLILFFDAHVLALRMPTSPEAKTRYTLWLTGSATIGLAMLLNVSAILVRL